MTPCLKINHQISGLNTIICSQSISFKDRSFKISKFIHLIIPTYLAWTIFLNGLVLFLWKLFWWWKCLKTTICIWNGLQGTCFDVYIKMRFGKIIWSSLIMQNLPRNEYLNFFCENLPFFMKFHEHLYLKILTPLVRRLLSCTNEEYIVIVSCLEIMPIYQGLILALKKINHLFS